MSSNRQIVEHISKLEISMRAITTVGRDKFNDKMSKLTDQAAVYVGSPVTWWLWGAAST